jgi:hypothetical protein
MEIGYATLRDVVDPDVPAEPDKPIEPDSAPPIFNRLSGWL